MFSSPIVVSDHQAVAWLFCIFAKKEGKNYKQGHFLIHSSAKENECHPEIPAAECVKLSPKQLHGSSIGFQGLNSINPLIIY